MEKLFVFNGAGTLLKSKLSGFRLLAIEIGAEKEMEKQLKEYEAKKGKGPWGLDDLAEIFKGIREGEIRVRAEAIVSQNLVKNAKKFITKLKKKGYFVAFYSSDPIEIVKVIQRETGLDDVIGNVLEYSKEDGKATGKLKIKVDRFDRAAKIKELIDKNNLTKEDVFIVGNSITSLPSKDFGKFISFNSDDPTVDNQANIVIKENDLEELYKYLD